MWNLDLTQIPTDTPVLCKCYGLPYPVVGKVEGGPAIVYVGPVSFNVKAWHPYTPIQEHWIEFTGEQIPSLRPEQPVEYEHPVRMGVTHEQAGRILWNVNNVLRYRIV